MKRIYQAPQCQCIAFYECQPLLDGSITVSDSKRAGNGFIELSNKKENDASVWKYFDE